MSKLNIFLSLLFICALTLLCATCPYNPNYPDPRPSPYDEEDRLSSWDSINQLLSRPSNWQRIVKDKNLFKLGDSVLSKVQTFDKVVRTDYDGSYGTFPAIDGSTVLLPLAAEIGWQFLDLSDDNTRNFFEFSTTNPAYIYLIGARSDNDKYAYLISEYQDAGKAHFDTYTYKKQPDIIFATSPSAAELDLAKSKGVALTVKPVCYDSFVFITHVDNPIDNLTAEQIRGIYSGRIRNLSEVGGDDGEIMAFQRERGSGSQTAMEEMVMAGEKMMDAPAGWHAVGMGMLIDFVAEYQNRSNSIGYTYKYYIDRLYKNSNIKILKVNGIAPNDDNARNLSYPFAAPYNGVIRSADANGVGGKFLDWMLSDEGQRVITRAGYVPLSR